MTSPEQGSISPDSTNTIQKVFKRYDGWEVGVYEGVECEDPERKVVLEHDLEKICSGLFDNDIKRGDIPVLIGDLIEVIGGEVRIDGDDQIREWSETVIDDKNNKMYDLVREFDPEEYTYVHAEIIIHDIDWYHIGTGSKTQADIRKPLITEVIESEPFSLSLHREVTNPIGMEQVLFQSVSGEEFNLLSGDGVRIGARVLNTANALSVLKDVYQAYKAGGVVPSQIDAEDTILAEGI